MKVIVYQLILVIILTAGDVLAQHHHRFGHVNGSKKDPAVAALLSIQPFPVALGHFYTNNWQRGIIYSAVELSLFIPAAILLGRNNWGTGMHNHSYYGYSNDRHWTSNERTQFNYLLAGYVLVKVLSAFDAGYSAENFNNHLSIKYDTDINTAVFSLNIPLR